MSLIVSIFKQGLFVWASSWEFCGILPCVIPLGPLLEKGEKCVNVLEMGETQKNEIEKRET